MARIDGIEHEIFPLNLGGNPFGWTSDTATSHAVLDAFVQAGGNFIDTADMYSQWVPGHEGGESERVIGQWLALNGMRDDLVIATKVGAMAEFEGLVHDVVIESVENCLSRLGTDYIDLLYAHHDDPEVDIEDQVRTFDSLVQSGDVKAIGLSNYSPERIREYLVTARRLDAAMPVALQPQYSLVEREYYETEVEPIVREYELAVFPYYALASGFLTGKYRTAEDLAQSTRGGAAKAYLSDEGLRVVDALDEIATSRGAQMATVALAWLLAKGVTAPIASVSRPEQLAALMAAPSLELTQAEVAALDESSEAFA